VKLRQNARELVLMEVSGIGTVLGEIRYNAQTETALFAMEKSAFFDLYFPCAVSYDQKNGPVVNPHVFFLFTQSSIRVQRSHVTCFIQEIDLNPVLVEQYNALLAAFYPPAPSADTDQKKGPEGRKPTGGKRVVSLKDHTEKRR
jgi:hypothetical protein